MGSYGVFDIMGPVMIGPSSSHTAGPCKIAGVARQVVGEKIQSAHFLLHGSLGEIYKGHGTDKALVAGILGFQTNDERLTQSLELAQKEGISVSFEKVDLHNAHPNTVKIEIKTVSGKFHTVTGSSLGGGKIVITEIDGLPLTFDGEHTTLLTKHKDQPGVVAHVTALLSAKNVNIASMELFRKERGDEATMILNTDSFISKDLLDQIRKAPGVTTAEVISASA